jgi:predicted amidohydrolase YtcJ
MSQQASLNHRVQQPLRFAASVVALGLLAAGCSDSGAPTEQIASGDQLTVVANAAVYTLDEAEPWAEAFVYHADGVIIMVGDEADALIFARDDAVVINAGANMVMPGFQDSHVQVPEAGINEGLCFLPAGLSLVKYETLAAECADDQWVRATGPSLFALRDTEESPLDVLDRAIPDRPALILDDLGHAVWTNSLGLAAAGIDADSPDPLGGVLHRDSSGRLTGLLLEDAQHLVRNAAKPADAVVDAGLQVAMDELVRNGLTTISDAGGYWGQGHVDAWLRADANDQLTVRAVNSLYLYPDLNFDEQIAEFESRFNNTPSSLLRFNNAKVYIDGILDLGTALMLAPYHKPPDPNYPSGFRYFETELLFDYVDALHAIGYRINFHAIGDGANREALSAVAAIEDTPEAIMSRRHRTTHTYLVDPEDYQTFIDLGVIADFQAVPDSTDPGYHEDLTEIIGDKAWDLIPTGAMLQAGVAVTLSSDWDADPLSPLGTIETAYALGHDNDSTEVLLTVVGGREAFRIIQFEG